VQIKGSPLENVVLISNAAHTHAFCFSFYYVKSKKKIQKQSDEYFANSYSLSTTSSVPSNTELFISYGSRSNDQLLQYYGELRDLRQHSSLFSSSYEGVGSPISVEHKAARQ